MKFRVLTVKLRKSISIIFLAIYIVSALSQFVYAGPPQHIRYEVAKELDLPPWDKLIVSWISGNISNNWSYIKLRPSHGLEEVPLVFIHGIDKRVFWRVESFDLFDGESPILDLRRF